MKKTAASSSSLSRLHRQENGRSLRSFFVIFLNTRTLVVVNGARLFCLTVAKFFSSLALARTPGEELTCSSLSSSSTSPTASLQYEEAQTTVSDNDSDKAVGRSSVSFYHQRRCGSAPSGFLTCYGKHSLLHFRPPPKLYSFPWRISLSALHPSPPAPPSSRRLLLVPPAASALPVLSLTDPRASRPQASSSSSAPSTALLRRLSLACGLCTRRFSHFCPLPEANTTRTASPLPSLSRGDALEGDGRSLRRCTKQLPLQEKQREENKEEQWEKEKEEDLASECACVFCTQWKRPGTQQQATGSHGDHCLPSSARGLFPSWFNTYLTRHLSSTPATRAAPSSPSLHSISSSSVFAGLSCNPLPQEGISFVASHHCRHLPSCPPPPSCSPPPPLARPPRLAAVCSLCEKLARAGCSSPRVWQALRACVKSHLPHIPHLGCQSHLERLYAEKDRSQVTTTAPLAGPASPAFPPCGARQREDEGGGGGGLVWSAQELDVKTTIRLFCLLALRPPLLDRLPSDSPPPRSLSSSASDHGQGVASLRDESTRESLRGGMSPDRARASPNKEGAKTSKPDSRAGEESCLSTERYLAHQALLHLLLSHAFLRFQDACVSSSRHGSRGNSTSRGGGSRTPSSSSFLPLSVNELRLFVQVYVHLVRDMLTFSNYQRNKSPPASSVAFLSLAKNTIYTAIRHSLPSSTTSSSSSSSCASFISASLSSLPSARHSNATISLSSLVSLLSSFPSPSDLDSLGYLPSSQRQNKQTEEESPHLISSPGHSQRPPAGCIYTSGVHASSPPPSCHLSSSRIPSAWLPTLPPPSDLVYSLHKRLNEEGAASLEASDLVDAARLLASQPSVQGGKQDNGEILLAFRVMGDELAYRIEELCGGGCRYSGEEGPDPPVDVSPSMSPRKGEERKESMVPERRRPVDCLSSCPPRSLRSRDLCDVLRRRTRRERSEDEGSGLDEGEESLTASTKDLIGRPQAAIRAVQSFAEANVVHEPFLSSLCEFLLSPASTPSTSGAPGKAGGGEEREGEETDARGEDEEAFGNPTEHGSLVWVDQWKSSEVCDLLGQFRKLGYTNDDLLKYLWTAYNPEIVSRDDLIRERNTRAASLPKLSLSETADTCRERRRRGRRRGKLLRSEERGYLDVSGESSYRCVASGRQERSKECTAEGTAPSSSSFSLPSSSSCPPSSRRSTVALRPNSRRKIRLYDRCSPQELAALLHSAAYGEVCPPPPQWQQNIVSLLLSSSSSSVSFCSSSSAISSAKHSPIFFSGLPRDTSTAALSAPVRCRSQSSRAWEAPCAGESPDVSRLHSLAHVSACTTVASSPFTSIEVGALCVSFLRLTPLVASEFFFRKVLYPSSFSSSFCPSPPRTTWAAHLWTRKGGPQASHLSSPGSPFSSSLSGKSSDRSAESSNPQSSPSSPSVSVPSGQERCLPRSSRKCLQAADPLSASGHSPQRSRRFHYDGICSVCVSLRFLQGMPLTYLPGFCTALLLHLPPVMTFSASSSSRSGAVSSAAALESPGRCSDDLSSIVRKSQFRRGEGFLPETGDRVGEPEHPNVQRLGRRLGRARKGRARQEESSQEEEDTAKAGKERSRLIRTHAWKSTISDSDASRLPSPCLKDLSNAREGNASDKWTPRRDRCLRNGHRGDEDDGVLAREERRTKEEKEQGVFVDPLARTVRGSGVDESEKEVGEAQEEEGCRLCWPGSVRESLFHGWKVLLDRLLRLWRQSSASSFLSLIRHALVFQQLNLLSESRDRNQANPRVSLPRQNHLEPLSSRSAQTSPRSSSAPCYFISSPSPTALSLLATLYLYKPLVRREEHQALERPCVPLGKLAGRKREEEERTAEDQHAEDDHENGRCIRLHVRNLGGERAGKPRAARPQRGDEANSKDESEGSLSSEASTRPVAGEACRQLSPASNLCGRPLGRYRIPSAEGREKACQNAPTPISAHEDGETSERKEKERDLMKRTMDRKRTVWSDHIREKEEDRRSSGHTKEDAKKKRRMAGTQSPLFRGVPGQLPLFVDPRWADTEPLLLATKNSSSRGRESQLRLRQRQQDAKGEPCDQDGRRESEAAVGSRNTKDGIHERQQAADEERKRRRGGEARGFSSLGQNRIAGDAEDTSEDEEGSSLSEEILDTRLSTAGRLCRQTLLSLLVYVHLSFWNAHSTSLSTNAPKRKLSSPPRSLRPPPNNSTNTILSSSPSYGSALRTPSDEEATVIQEKKSSAENLRARSEGAVRTKEMVTQIEEANKERQLNSRIQVISSRCSSPVSVALRSLSLSRLREVYLLTILCTSSLLWGDSGSGALGVKGGALPCIARTEQQAELREREREETTSGERVNDESEQEMSKRRQEEEAIRLLGCASTSYSGQRRRISPTDQGVHLRVLLQQVLLDKPEEEQRLLKLLEEEQDEEVEEARGTGLKGESRKKPHRKHMYSTVWKESTALALRSASPRLQTAWKERQKEKEEVLLGRQKSRETRIERLLERRGQSGRRHVLQSPRETKRGRERDERREEARRRETRGGVERQKQEGESHGLPPVTLATTSSLTEARKQQSEEEEEGQRNAEESSLRSLDVGCRNVSQKSLYSCEDFSAPSENSSELDDCSRPGEGSSSQEGVSVHKGDGDGGILLSSPTISEKAATKRSPARASDQFLYAHEESVDRCVRAVSLPSADPPSSRQKSLSRKNLPVGRHSHPGAPEVDSSGSNSSRRLIGDRERKRKQENRNSAVSADLNVLVSSANPIRRHEGIASVSLSDDRGGEGRESGKRADTKALQTDVSFSGESPLFTSPASRAEDQKRQASPASTRLDRRFALAETAARSLFTANAYGYGTNGETSPPMGSMEIRTSKFHRQVQCALYGGLQLRDHLSRTGARERRGWYSLAKSCSVPRETKSPASSTIDRKDSLSSSFSLLAEKKAKTRRRGTGRRSDDSRMGRKVMKSVKKRLHKKQKLSVKLEVDNLAKEIGVPREMDVAVDYTDGEESKDAKKETEGEGSGDQHEERTCSRSFFVDKEVRVGPYTIDLVVTRTLAV